MPVLLITWSAKLSPFVAYRLSRIMAKFLSIFNSNVKRVATLNLQIAFPNHNDDEKKRVLLNVLHQSLYSIFEIARVWCEDLSNLQNRFLTVKGYAILQQLIDEKKPIIVVCPHLGCWEAVGYWLNSIGYSMSILYNPLANKCLDDFMIKVRQKGGNEIVPINNKGVMRIYKDLRQHKIVGILPDQVPKREASRVMAPFFSADAATMTLIHTLIKKTKAVPVFITATREGYSGFNIHIQSGEDMMVDDVQQSVTAMNKRIERMIDIAPEQYQWTYHRYRYNPLIDYKKGRLS